MNHLDDGLVRRLAGGLATEEETAQARAHLEECAECRERAQQSGLSLKPPARSPVEATMNAQSPAPRSPSEPTMHAPPPPARSPSEATMHAQPPVELLARMSASVSEPATKLEPPASNKFFSRPPPEPEPPPLPRGTTVGRYLILQPVGQGGMGVVYAAYDPELDRKVALKLLKVRLSQNDDGQARLLREAQAMARVSHPNVTAVYDAGTFGDQVFLAMELIEGGRTLRDWIIEKRTWREILDVMISAGRGLAAAHAAGLVHRDFKPENVLVGQDGRVHVTDFGLARLAQDEKSGPVESPIPRFPTPSRREDPGELSDTLRPEPSSGGREDAAFRLGQQLTQVGAVVGTPSYMAPEQHQGRPPDTRSDQFSFCTTLYYTLYQQRPFDPRKLAEAVTGKSDVAPASLIQPPPRTPRVPAWVKRVLMRGLAISPEARFSSMEALLARLSRPRSTARWRWAALVGVVLVGAGALAQRELSLRRSLLCSGAEQELQGAWDGEVENRVKAAFDATGMPYAPFTFNAIKTSLDGYRRDWATMHTEACVATRVRGDQTEAILTLRMTCLDRRLKELRALTALLAKADTSTLEHAVDAVGGLPRISTCADVDALSAVVPPPEDPLTRAEVARLDNDLAQVEVLRNAGHYQVALDKVEGMVEAVRRVRYRPLLAEVLSHKGFLLTRLGRGEDAERVLVEAWTAADVARHDEVRVRVAGDLIFVVGTLESHVKSALRWADLGEAALARLGRSSESEVHLRLNEGGGLLGAGQLSQALQQLERAQKLDIALNGDRSVERALILTSLAQVYHLQGDNTRALQLHEEATAASERLQGPDHPYSGVAHNNTAGLYLMLGDLPRADEHAWKAAAVLEVALGKEHPWVSLAYDTLACVRARQRRFSEAEEYSRRVLANSEKVIGPTHPFLANPLDTLAYVELETGRAREALPLLERALKLNNPDPELAAKLRFHLARALVETRGDARRARELARQALDGFRGQGIKDQVELAERWMKAQWP